MRGWWGGWGRELVMRQRVCEMCACVCVLSISLRNVFPRASRRFAVPQLHCAPNTAAVSAPRGTPSARDAPPQLDHDPCTTRPGPAEQARFSFDRNLVQALCTRFER